MKSLIIADMGMALVMVIHQARRLIDQGAEVDFVDRWTHRGEDHSTTPLVEAAMHSHTEVLVSLSSGVFIHDSTMTVILRSIDFLLSAGADLDYQDARGMSPLYAAAQKGHLKVVKLLVNKGANIHQVSVYGVSIIQNAALHGQDEMVYYLMSKVAEFEAQGTLAKA